jgi:hypothetical protein
MMGNTMRIEKSKELFAILVLFPSLLPWFCLFIDQAVVCPFSHWLPCSHLILTLFPISPAKVLPCPSSSHISNKFLSHSLIIALMMAVSTSETLVNFYQTVWPNFPEDINFLFALVS